MEVCSGVWRERDWWMNFLWRPIYYRCVLRCVKGGRLKCEDPYEQKCAQVREREETEMWRPIWTEVCAGVWEGRDWSVKTHVKHKSTLVSGHPQEPRGRPPPLHDPERHRGNHPTGQCSSPHPLLSAAGLIVFVGPLFVPTGTGQCSSLHPLLSAAGLIVFVGPLFEARVWF